MTFQEFFDFVDDLIKSKLTVINLQDGVMCKIEFDKQLTYVYANVIIATYHFILLCGQHKRFGCFFYFHIVLCTMLYLSKYNTLGKNIFIASIDSELPFTSIAFVEFYN